MTDTIYPPRVYTKDEVELMLKKQAKEIKDSHWLRNVLEYQWKGLFKEMGLK